MASSATQSFFVPCLRREMAQCQHARLFSASSLKHAEKLAVRSKTQQMNKARSISRRRRGAPVFEPGGEEFEQLPYQCFQEARKVLLQDRQEKLAQIEEQRRRIAAAEAKAVEEYAGEFAKKGKIVAMNRQLEKLKIFADINDPLIKKRFENGQGDLNRPIYRHLAEQKWRSYKYKILAQRIEQFHLFPDLLQKLDPVVDISMAFRGKNVPPGDFVPSELSEIPPKLTVQVFDKGERLVTVVVVDADVPNLENDSFDYRCHFIAANIPISPTEPHVPLSRVPGSQVILPWMPPHAQKGSPYHRMAIFILQQSGEGGEANGGRIDIEAARAKEERLGFKLRSFVDRYHVKPVGATLFRTIWDEGTKGVMDRAGLEGADIEFRKKQPEALPWKYKVKDGERYR